MDKNEIIQKLKVLAPHFSLLYVEDNEKLRTQATTFLEKFFTTIYVACDGQEGLALFEAHHPDIVITDLKMPHMSGMEMIQAIRKEDKETLILISSAYDDKDLLFGAIHEGVFRYLKKPLDIYSLSQALLEAIQSRHHDDFEALFSSQIKNIYHFEHNLFLVLKDKQPLSANDRFLDFFGATDIEVFHKNFPYFLDIFLPQKEFFSAENTSDLKMLFGGTLALKNAKLMDAKGHLHHMILSSHILEENYDEIILSFHDITELGLLPLFNMPHAQLAQRQTDKSVMDFLKQIFQNGGDLKLFNLYKGLPISSPTSVSYLSEDRIGFKTSVKQIDAISYEKQTILRSKLLPMDLKFDNLLHLPSTGNEVIFAHGVFSATSATQRKTIRLVPDNRTQITLLINDRAVGNGHKVLDISAKGLRMQGKNIPDSLAINDILRVDIVLYLKKIPLIINSDVTIFGITDFMQNKEKTKELVLLFSEASKIEKNLTSYLSSRQLEIIREFKGNEFHLSHDEES